MACGIGGGQAGRGRGPAGDYGIDLVLPACRRLDANIDLRHVDWLKRNGGLPRYE